MAWYPGLIKNQRAGILKGEDPCQKTFPSRRRYLHRPPRRETPRFRRRTPRLALNRRGRSHSPNAGSARPSAPRGRQASMRPPSGKRPSQRNSRKRRPPRPSAARRRRRQLANPRQRNGNRASDSGEPLSVLAAVSSAPLHFAKLLDAATRRSHHACSGAHYRLRRSGRHCASPWARYIGWNSSTLLRANTELGQDKASHRH